MIIVTGATGQLGHAIVEKLAHRVPVAQIAASVRDPAKASGLARLGVRVREGDFARPETLASAFEGATQVLLISSNALAYGGDTLAQHRAAIDAARSAGARRIVYTSHMSASARSKFAPSRDHAATEAMLRESGLAWTALRNGFYASSGIMLMGNAFETGTLDAPQDGKVSWTAHVDLVEAAVAVLVDEGRFEGPTPPLTGAQALDFADLARISSELFGRAIHRGLISDDAQRAKMAARGAPPHLVELSLGYYLASRDGEFAAVDPTLEQLLGRRSTAVRDVLTQHLAR